MSTNLTQYLNKDGTYTSPKNSETYKSLKAFRSHWFYEKALVPKNQFKFIERKCQYCDKITNTNLPNHIKHEKNCYLNPTNLKECLQCSLPIKDYKHSKGTCSHSCSNVYFKELRNKPEKYTGYITICFYHHKKECIICGEKNIVAVHHFDHNNKNNNPENLIPLCPTHHIYVHSKKYKHLVIDQINQYQKLFVGVKGFEPST